MPTDTWWNLPVAKRDRITQAAMVEFGERGFSAGSLNVISRAAGISKGSLFQYFEDKLDLFSTVCQADADDIAVAALVGVDLERMGYFEVLHRIVINWLRYFRKHPVSRAIAFASNNEIDAMARAAVRSITNDRYRTVFGPLAKRAVDRGELRSDIDLDQLLTLTALLLRHLNSAPFYAHADPSLELHKKSAKEVERISHELVDALARGYSA